MPTLDRVVAAAGDHLVTVAENAAWSPATWLGRRWRLRVLRPQGANAPAEIGSTAPFAGQHGDVPVLAVAGDRAFVAGAGETGLRTFDLADPAHPRPLGHLALAGAPQAIAATGDYVLLATRLDPVAGGTQATPPSTSWT